MLDYTLPHVDLANGQMAVTHLKAFGLNSRNRLRRQRLILSRELKIFSIQNLLHVSHEKKIPSANYLINRDRVWELSRINCFHRGCGSRGALVTRLAQLKTHVSNKTRTKWKSGFFPINQSEKKKKNSAKVSNTHISPKFLLRR